jgi:hypothetical protein
MSCRLGACSISWTNGDYGYGVRFPMSNPDLPPPTDGYRLTVSQGERVILAEDGFTATR